MRFDSQRGLFTFSFRHDAAVAEPTELYVPNSQFPAGYRVEVSDGEVEVLRDEQRLLYRHSGKDMPHMIRVISNNPPPAELSPYGTSWRLWGWLWRCCWFCWVKAGKTKE